MVAEVPAFVSGSSAVAVCPEFAIQTQRYLQRVDKFYRSSQQEDKVGEPLMFADTAAGKTIELEG